MKRHFFFLVVLAMLTCLSGCSQENQNVPDRMLEWEVEDYLNYNSINSVDTYTSYDMQTSHSYDKQTKTDTVSIKLTVYYPKCVASSSYEGTYKYNKEKEEWEFLRGDRWSDMQIESFTMSASQEEWIAALKKTGFANIDFATEAEIEETKERFQKKLQEEVPSGSVTDLWLLGARDDISDPDSDIVICCMTLNDENSVESAYWAIKNEDIDSNGYDVSYSAKGENYEYMLVQDDVGEWTLLVKNEKRVFYIYFCGIDWVPYDLLYEVGFIYDYTAD